MLIISLACACYISLILSLSLSIKAPFSCKMLKHRIHPIFSWGTEKTAGRVTLSNDDAV